MPTNSESSRTVVDHACSPEGRCAVCKGAQDTMKVGQITLAWGYMCVWTTTVATSSMMLGEVLKQINVACSQRCAIIPGGRNNKLCKSHRSTRRRFRKLSLRSAGQDGLWLEQVCSAIHEGVGRSGPPLRSVAGRIPKLERGAVHARRMQKSLNLSQAPTHNCGSLRSLDSQLAGTPSSWLLGSRPSGQQLSQHDVPRGRGVWCRISASVLLRGSCSKRETCFSQTGDDATETSEFHSHVHMLVRGSLVEISAPVHRVRAVGPD